jgi:putative DNA primase/helicase
LDWPDPIIPGQAVTPEVPAELLPGWVGDMAAAVALHTKTPPVLAVMVALSVLSTVLQRRFEVAPHGTGYGYTEPLSLWTLTALPPGTNKTAVINLMTHPLDRWEKLARDRMRRDVTRVSSMREVATKRIETLKIQAGKAKNADEREKLRAEIQQETEDMPAELIPPRLITTSVTPETLEQMLVDHHERMAIISDEGGIFQTMSGQYSGGVANIDVYLKGHSGSPLRVERAKRKAHIDKPALSFGLAIQPGILAESAKTKRFRDSGLLGRFLYALPKSNVGTRDVREQHPIPEAIKAAWEADIFALLDKMDWPIGAPVVLPFADDAREHWLDLAQKVENQQGDGGKYEHISDWTSKLSGAVARLAGLMRLAVQGVEAKSVDLDSVKRAVQLGRLLTPHAVAAFALMGASKTETDALHVDAPRRRRIRADGGQQNRDRRLACVPLDQGRRQYRIHKARSPSRVARALPHCGASHCGIEAIGRAVRD